MWCLLPGGATERHQQGGRAQHVCILPRLLLLPERASALHASGERSRVPRGGATLRPALVGSALGFLFGSYKEPSPGAEGSPYSQGSAPVLSADLGALPAGLVTHTGKPVASPFLEKPGNL